jgi:hypothetical protein
MGRYDSLAILLHDSPDGVVELSFGEIDDAVGRLPPSARRYREWWANSSSPQGRAWLAAGYRVEAVDVTAEWVRFAPATAGRARRSRRRSGDEERSAKLPPTTGNAHVEVAFGWHQLGAVGLGTEGRLQFPKVASTPGVYRLTLWEAGAVARVYVGESINLARRVRNYVRPGPTQRTSLRINELLTEHMQRDGVSFEVAGDVRFTVDDRDVAVDLSRKADRVLVEQAALVQVVAAGHPVANL